MTLRGAEVSNDIPPGYPARWEADVVLRDGATVHLRPIRPGDAAGISELHKRLSAETIYFRFFSPLTSLSPRMLERFVNVDYLDRFALVAELGTELIAVGRYERLPTAPRGETEAEVAFLVDDAHQGRGLGSLLLEHLAAAAKHAGITRFLADTLPENRRMLAVFHEAGFGEERTFADGVVRVAFPIAPTPSSLAASHQRERDAAASSVRRLLSPGSVAVIGASRRPGTLGHLLMRTIIEGGFNGPVYPVNPAATHVASVRSYPSVLEIPDPIDLAVIVVPASAVETVLEQCARKHVGGLVVISSGFADAGAAGAELEHRMVAEARRHGMRLIGPNCMGIVNTDPSVSLNATFSPSVPAGRIGFISQSGGLGVVILDEMSRRGLGISTFVSAGNKADVSGNDLLHYWDGDDRTDVILMYIETFGNPRTFARVARRVARKKPIAVVKGRRTPGQVPAVGNGFRANNDDDAVDALFRQSGVIRTDTLEELFDVAQVLASQPLPRGPRVAIVANSGGPGVLASDACGAAGLELASLSASTLQRLSTPGQSVANPVELASDAAPPRFHQAVEALLLDESVDSVIVVYTSPIAAPLETLAAAIEAASNSAPGKPVLTCALGRRALLAPSQGGRCIPSFAFPESAARALGSVTAYSAWRSRPEGTIPTYDSDNAKLRQVVAEAPRGRWLGREASRELLATYGIEVLSSKKVDSARAAVLAARELGYPVVLGRAAPEGRAHPERAALRLGLIDDNAVRAAWAELESAGVPMEVQAMGPQGVDLSVEVWQHQLFGPLVGLGLPSSLGGPPLCSHHRGLPLSDLDAAELTEEVLASTATARRDWPPRQLAALEEVLMRVAQLAGDLPELAELELNPLIVSEARACAAGATARLADWQPRPELAIRRLR